MDLVISAGEWGRAFNCNGFADKQAGVSQRVSDEIGCEAPHAISCDRPSAEHLQLCYPKKKKAPSARMLRFVDLPPREVAAPLSHMPPAASFPFGVAAIPDEDEPHAASVSQAIAFRTRSRLRVKTYK